jgi:L-aspartate semialdehyde sulfurtransferase ferredoxin
MATERVKFTFPPDLVDTPVIYNMGKEFGVVTNIRRANMSHDRGWVILEVVGTPEAVQKSLAWAKEQGVRIEPDAAEAHGAGGAE